MVVGGARAYHAETGHVALLVALTSSVFWLAHVYAHSLGESIVRDERLRLEELRDVARREFTIVAAAFPLIGALLLGTLGVLSPTGAYWLAFALGLVVLGVEGIRFARLEHMGALATLAVMAANLGFGVLLVGLKLLVSH